jgi:hypothetical protein
MPTRLWSKFYSFHIHPIMFSHQNKWLDAIYIIPLRIRDTNPFRRPRQAESISSVSTADGYFEYEPTAAEWIRDQIPTGRQVFNYFKALFPFLAWLPHYNLQWFIGDLIAGTIFILFQFMSSNSSRCHCWCSRCTPRDGLCKISQFTC